MIDKKRTSAQQVDNYDGFITRLDAASKQLTVRRDVLSRTTSIISMLLNQNTTDLRNWEQRLATVSGLLDRHTGSESNRHDLTELHVVAQRMDTMFRNRVERVGARLALIQQRTDEINRSLLQLYQSRMKLTSSQMVTQERANLNRAVAELGGPLDAGTAALPDAGLHSDLQQAREAVVLAEALLELKGN